MLLLPGSLPKDSATLKALCVGLAALADIASCLQHATVTEFSGSWSDAERELSGDSGDLNDAVKLADQVSLRQESAVSVAIASPFHTSIGLADLTPADPSALSLTPDDSRALCDAADVYLRDEGIRLHFVDTARWLLTCNRTVEVLTERPDWIIGQQVRPNLPRGRDARLVERWMNELQMLLHTHPVNVAREARRLPPVNLVWLWGFGARLNPATDNRPPATNDTGIQARGSYHVEHRFAKALREGDAPAWQATWASVARAMLAAETIILGDNRPTLRLTATTPSFAKRILAPFKRKATLAEVLTALQQSR